MKKTIILTVVLIFCASIALKAGILSALLMFILLGVVPGTDIVIPANIMLLIMSAATGALLLYSTARSVLRIILDRHTAAQESPIDSRLPKHRFKKIEA